MTDETEQPSDCPHCGTEFVLDVDATRLTASMTEREGMVTGRFICPNPDCPGSESHLAPAAPQ